MKFSYLIAKEDYLRAVQLKRAVSQKSFLLLKMLGMAAAAFLVYLSVAALTGTTGQENYYPYVASFVTLAVFLAYSNSRLMPALTFQSNLRRKEIPPDYIGRHDWELLDDHVSFRFGRNDFRVRYPGIAHVLKHDQALMLFTGVGSVEVIPNQAFIGSYKRQDALDQLAEGVSQSKDRPERGFPVLEQLTSSESIKFQFTAEDFLHSSQVHQREVRRQSVGKPVTWLWLVFLLIILTGSAKGIYDFSTGLVNLPSKIILVYYVVGILLALPGLLILARSTAVSNWQARQLIKAGSFPAGFLGERTIRWNEDFISFEYGDISSCLAWDSFSHILSDDQGYYPYQGSVMVTAIPRRIFSDSAVTEVFEQQVRKLSASRT